ncbi:MAG: hypothetical protein JXA82_20010 [Sedimentisphaerales bacterium]|nr:hypothetical protein [Sedimentisphaerales bacterium]
MRTSASLFYSYGILCTVLFCSVNLSAQVDIQYGDIIYVDFGPSQTVSTGWNTMSAADGTITDAVTSDETVTVVDISLPDRFTGENTNGTETPDAALGFPSQATRDSFYGNDVEWSGQIQPTAQVLISSLNPSQMYELTFFASRMSAGENRQTQYAINGQGGMIETIYLNPSNNADTAVTSQMIAPTTSGEITIDIQKGPENVNGYGFYYLGVLVIKATQDPHAAGNPVPVNGATLVPDDTFLSWTKPEAFDDPRYNVYFWYDANDVEEVLDISETTVDPGILSKGKTYYWVVDVIDPNEGGTPVIWYGKEWSFTVIPATPLVQEDPQEQWVFEGETATFSVVLEDDTNATYQWGWVSEDPNNPFVALSDDGRISGATTNIMSIADATLNDEHDYLCRATNDAGSTDSLAAALVIKRLLSHWPLDGTLEDVIRGKDGTMTGVTPAFETGIIDDALSLSGDPSDWVLVGPVDISGNQKRTIAGWAKATSDTIADWTGIFGFSNPTGASGLFFDMERLGNNGNGFGLHQYNWEVPIKSSLLLDEWVFLVASHDGQTTRWYGNGTLIGEEARSINTNDMWTFGKRGDNDNTFIGMIDDVQLYNYDLSDVEVAKLWTDIMGGYVCIDGTPMYDFNEDCIVDLADFAMFAEQWLACTRYPQCFE